MIRERDEGGRDNAIANKDIVLTIEMRYKKVRSWTNISEMAVQPVQSLELGRKRRNRAEGRRFRVTRGIVIRFSGFRFHCVSLSCDPASPFHRRAQV